MKIYKIGGRENPIEIFTEEEEKNFLEEARLKNLKVNLVSDKLGNQTSSTEDATVEQAPIASNQEISQSQNNQQINTESKLVDGSSESQIHNWLNYQDDKGEITTKPFFNQKEDESIAQLKEAYPGFKFETTNFKVEDWKITGGFGQVIKATSPDGKNSTKFKVNLDKGNLFGELKNPPIEDTHDYNYEKLTDFVDTYSDDETNKNAAKQRQLRIDNYKKFNNDVKYSDQEKQDIESEFYDINDDGTKGEFKPDVFNTQTETRKRLTPMGKHDVMQSYEHKHQPYTEELKEAEKLLTNKQNPNPSQNQIREKAAELIVDKRLDKIVQKNTENIFDQYEKDDEEFKQYKLDLSAKEFQNEMNAKMMTKLNLEREVYDGDDAMTSRLTVLLDRIEDEDYQFDLDKYSEDEIVKLETGRSVPASAVKEFQDLYKQYKDKTDKINELRLDLVENSHYVKHNNQMMDLLKRNYNGLEEFTVETGLGFYEMAIGSAYGGSRLFGGKDSFSDEAYIDFKNKINNIREGYKKDVEFDDAFESLGNFGSFYMQELSNQLPVFLSLATPGGMSYIGTQSFGDRYSDYQRDNKNPLTPKVSQEKMWWGSLGYATSEVVFETLTTLPLVRAFKKSIFNAPGKNQLFKDGAYQYFKNATPKFLGSSVSEGVSEGLTGLSQNMIDGKWDNLTDNLDHMMFSGLMFGTTLSSAPFLKGLYASQFSDYKTTAKVRGRVNQMKKLKIFNEKIQKGISIYGESKLGTQEDIDANNLKIKELQKANEADYKKTESKISTLSQTAADFFMKMKSRQQELRLEAGKIRNSLLPNDVKQDRLGDIKAEFDALENSISDFKSKDTFNSSWSLFKGRKKNKSEIQRITDLAKQSLRKNNKNLTDENIDDASRIIYNKEAIYKDIKKRKGRTTKLRNKLVHHDTIDETIDYLKKDTENKIKKLEGTDTQKQNQIKKLNEKLNENIKEIKNGAHGFMSVDANGNKVSVVNVDNMAKDDRLETKTHELNHIVFTDALGFNPKSFKGLSDQILTWTKENNNDAHQRILLNTERRKDGSLIEDEVVAVFFEEVAAGNINLNKSTNSNFAGLLGYLIGQGTKNSTEAEIDLAGETDAIKFLTTIAKKIKNDDLTISDIKKIKKSKILSEQKTFEDKGFDETKFSKSQNPELDKLGKNFTNETWKSEGYNTAMKTIEKDPFVRNIIRNKYKAPSKMPATFVDDVINSPEFQNMVKRFNKDKWGTKNENESLFAYINSQMSFRAGDVYNKFKDQFEGKKIEADAVTTEGQPRIQVEDVSANMETLTDNINYFETEVQPESTESIAEQSKLRKEIGIGNLGKGEIFKKVRTALATSKAVDEKGFIKDYEKNLANLLEPTIARILNDPAKLKKFRVGTLEAIPIKTLVQMQKFLPEKIFVKDHGRQTNLTNLSKFVEKGLLPADILNNTPESKKRRAAGVRVYERLNTTTKQFENYIDAQAINPKTGKPSGTRGNNRAKVISEVSKAIGKDATPETLTPEFIEDYLNIKDLKGKITPEKVIEKISEQIDRSPGLKFSKKAVLEIQDIIQADPDFKRKDRDHIDKVLGTHIEDKVFKHGTQPEIDNYFRDLEEIVIGNIPANLFGANPASVFSMIKKSKRILPNEGVDIITLKSGEKITINDYFDRKRITLRDKIKKGKVKFGKPFVGKGGDYVYGKTYGDMFGKTEAEILKSEKNGTAKRINEMHQSMHQQLWQRINDSIQQDPMNAKIWGSYLSLVGQDVNHPHRMGAEYLGHSTKPKGVKTKKGVKQYEWEHAMPATAAYLYLLNASLGGYDFNTAYELVMKNYKLIALDSAQDLKLKNAGRSTGMGKGWDLLTNSWIDRYFHPDVAKIRKGIDPNSIVGLDGKTFSETFNINADGKPAIIKRSQSDINKTNNLLKAFNKQAEIVKKINKELQADLEKRGYKFSKSGMARGMSTFDFDETLIIDGENFVVATDPKTGEKINIKSGDWPTKGPELAEQGYEFNFDDFVNVRGGVDGPLLQKMKNQIKKYGPENVFVLTARPQDAAPAIDGWLKSKGINIPSKNITGLAQSEGQAKADWMLEKFAEGYNDMYFVDDALPNVKAVKDVLEQLDIKSKVVQAKVKFSKKAPLDFNIILEQSKGIAAGKKFSVAEARKRGISKGRFTFFVPPSAEDFKGLLYSFLGKGKKGDAHMKWFKENLLDPYAKGYREWNTYKQAMADDYAALKKQFPNVSKMLNNKVKGTSFTNDSAVRVYLWDKAGFDIPGISKALKDKLVKQVNSNPELKQFAEGLSTISRRPEGYVQPGEYWIAQTIGSDLNNIVGKVARKEFLSEWINNKDIIFNEDNLNKIEAVYGSGFREALENMLWRMENGTNRTTGKDKTVNKFLNWINGSVGATMFWNMRSAILQTISTVNFINWGDNNIFTAAKAFANQPQFWSDFAFIFNSPMLKQRRAGLQIDVSASELTRAFADGRSKPEAVIAYLLEKGFTPTKIADSFAIALGGSTFYRNRLNTYLKQGMSEAKAKEQAWLDFQEVAEETQQSSRPDLISMQQAGVLGRIILAWQNTPMQMTRLTKKAMSDLVNRRGSDKANISRIIYYGIAQNVIFGALQTGLMFTLFGNDEDEEKKKKLELRVANGAFDTLLRGTGVYGAAISTLKNVLLKWREESKKGWNRDDMNIAQEAINLSPPIGSKLRKIMNAVRTEKYNRGVSEQIGLRIENPNLSIATNLTEALTNIPVARTLNKMNNVEEALTGNHELWQRVALVSGWSRWSVGVKDEELEEAKAEAKEARKIKRDKDKAIKKEEEKKLKDEEKKKVEEKKKEEGIKKVRCSATKSNGQRCSMMVETKAKSAKCMYHKSYNEKEGSDIDGDGNKEFRCTATKGNGQRCKNRTENKNKKCYAHQ